VSGAAGLMVKPGTPGVSVGGADSQSMKPPKQTTEGPAVMAATAKPYDDGADRRRAAPRSRGQGSPDLNGVADGGEEAVEQLKTAVRQVEWALMNFETRQKEAADRERQNSILLGTINEAVIGIRADMMHQRAINDGSSTAMAEVQRRLYAAEQALSLHKQEQAAQERDLREAEARAQKAEDARERDRREAEERVQKMQDQIVGGIRWASVIGLTIVGTMLTLIGLVLRGKGLG